MKKIFLLLLVVFSFSGCEKDDICNANTVTTPQVVISFYDTAIVPTLKNVNKLRIISQSMTDSIDYHDVSSIKIPLKTFATATTFNFIKNGSDYNTTNDETAVLNFLYTKNDFFVSRACGYKTTFLLTNTNANLLQTASWINHLEIVNPSIENENTTHVKIFF